MNERIKELAIEAGFQYIKDEGIGWAGNHNASLPKFAELIVQDCLKIVNRHEYSYHEADPLWETAQLIKEHFGVES
jgi:hypothetical protein